MSEGHHAIELLWKGLNVVAFLALVYYFGKRPVGEAFSRYFQSLTEELTRSEKDLQQAQEEFRKAKESLEDAQRRYEEQLKLASQTAQYIREEEEKKAQQISSRIRERAREAIQIELKKAKEELLRYGAEKAYSLAVDLLKERFSDERISSAYIEKSLRKLEAQK